ncbi:DUF4367 domain-containing protein [Oceanirhabdus sp. W0125-5]|uniref:DUF4367 domain-containing protein n=1 Tax=Oceanirhabdus sp. W0125-5 TaxID=2999116 RepID=UPI0022F31B43|nr:DUF4367 domain-containing protein [Oceanirhabdus sp. W0125-5]WBW96578.1 DUF4367 domain-containing protein [Oceanirhabdus sp. W0125-5]
MKKDNIENLIEESLIDYEEKMELEGMIIPDFNETMNKVKDKINKEDNENINILEFNKKYKRSEGFMKKQVKKYVAVAAMLSILVVGGGVYSLVGNNSNGNTPGVTEKNTENGGVQIPNPWVNADSVEEVEKECGFEIEEFNYLPEGFNKSEIVYLKSDDGFIVRQFARNSAEERISIEKINKNIENDGDYTVYDKEETINVGDLLVTVKYTGEDLKKAQWEKGDFKYSIMSDNKIQLEDMVKIIEGLKF